MKTKFSTAFFLEGEKKVALNKQWRTHRHSVRKASPVEVGARPANAVLDRFGDDGGYEHREQQACPQDFTSFRAEVDASTVINLNNSQHSWE
jgi:hypothetical protein